MKYTRRVYVDMDEYSGQKAAPVPTPEEKPAVQAQEETPVPPAEPAGLPDVEDVPEVQTQLPPEDVTADIVEPEAEAVTETPQIDSPTGQNSTEVTLEKLFKLYEKTKGE